MKVILLLTTLLLSTNTFAQIHVGSNAIAMKNKPGKLTVENIDELKNTTTLFTLQWKDYDHLEDFERIISSVWKITNFKIIKPDETNNYAGKKGYSFFTFGGFYTEGSGSGPFTMHISYDLWIPHANKKGKITGQNFYSRTLLCLDGSTVKASNEPFKGNFSDHMLQYIYNDATFNNWGAGFLKGYLKTINDIIAANETRGPFTYIEDNNALAPLGKDTLFIPDYVYIHFNPFNGNENDRDEDEGDFSKSYLHPIKFVSSQDLNNMILSRNDNFFYLIYIRSSADKFVNVYQNNKGMVYARYTMVSYNFKSKDLAKLDDVIRR